MKRSEITALCKTVFDAVPDYYEMPGGKTRKTIIIGFKADRFVLSNRKSAGRAALEAMVLGKLSVTGLVPQLIYHKGSVLIQEYLHGQRLSEALEHGNAQARQNLLHSATQSLLELQIHASKAGLSALAPPIGARPGWAQDFANTPDRLARALGLTCPQLDMQTILQSLSEPDPQFIKWDARPGNAITHKGKIAWFDWEHAGCRSSVDDLVWLLADEWCPDDSFATNNALTKVAERAGQPIQDITRQFKTRAVLHSCVRLSLIFNRKGEGDWWNREMCLAKDKIGITAAHVDLLCTRAANWAIDVKALHPLIGLLHDINDHAGRL